AFNGGTVDVQGAYDASIATVVSNGTVTFEPSATLTSLGQLLTVSGGTAMFPAGTALSLPALTITGGTLTSGDLTVTGLLTWSGGTISGAGTTTAQGGLTLNGPYRVLDGRTLLNPGTATWTSGTFYLSNGAVLENTGTLDDQAGANIQCYTGAQPTFS